MQAQIKELHKDRFFKSVHDGIRSKLHHLVSDVPAAQKPKFFKLVEAAVRAEEWILQTKKKIEHTKDAKATTFILRTPWKLKSLAVKLADIGFEFPDDSEHECAHDEDEDVSSAEDAIKGDLME